MNTKLAFPVFIILLCEVLGASGIGDDDGDDRGSSGVLSITGKFELVSSPSESDFDKYLEAMEYTDEARQQMHGMRPAILEISKKSDNSWSIKLTTRIRAWAIQFQSGVEFQEELFDFRKVRSTVVVRDNRIEKVQAFGTFEARQIATFTREGLTIRFIAKGKSALQQYKRIESTGN